MPYKDPEKRRRVNRESAARYRARQPERRSVRSPEARRADSQRYQTRHPERRRASRTANYARNADARRAYSRRYLQVHRAEKIAANAAWRRAHPELVRAINARRYARHRGAPGSHTAQEWAEKIALFAGCCAYCGESGSLTRDHRVPLTRGGTNDIDNIVPACLPCNSAKRNRTDHEFIALRIQMAAA